jgi:hypothetical protein
MATKRKADDSDGDWDGEKRKRPIISKTKKATNGSAVKLSAPSLQGQSHRAPTPKTHFPFMALPQELQDIVYDELWEEDGHLVLAPTSLKERWPDRPPGRVLLDYGRPAGYYHIGLPQWLMTNVAMFQKELKQLLTKSNLSWDEGQMRRQNKLKPSPWLDIPSYTKLDVHFQLRSSDGFEFKVRDGMDKRLQEMLGILSPNLKTLNITISMSLMSFGHVPNVVFPELAVTLDRIEEVNVKLGIRIQSNIHGQMKAIFDGLETELQAAVKAIGTGVGVEGTLTLKEEIWRRTFLPALASVKEVKLKVTKTLGKQETVKADTSLEEQEGRSPRDMKSGA